ncbi:peptidoglycan-binding protein [Streptomyces sp. NPDC002889]|uniref:peptidoglycan-binding protein n=1 Tax=Streptomyces sp. NPDC002889 TaxID=3364669 RepID=UPI0036B7BD1F
MKVDDTESERVSGSGPDARYSITDSFQRVLAALDAARAELHETEPRLYGADEERVRAGSPPPSGRSRGPGRGTGLGGPPASRPPFPPSPAFPPSPSQEPEVGFEDLDLFRPETAQGEAFAAPPSVVVEPLWARGAHLRGTQPAVVGEPLWAGSAVPADTPPSATAPLPGFLEDGTPRGHAPNPEEPWWGAAHRRRDAASSDIAGPHTGQWPDETPQMSPQPPPARWRVRIRGRVLPRLVVKPGRVAGAFGVGAASGLIVASSMLTNSPMAPAPSAPSAQPERPLPGDGAVSTPGASQPDEGALRQGDNGQEVSDLQKRLLQVPNIYDDGETDGHYDIEVQAAVARFQEWYGVRGDETGVYGDSTRRGLTSRTR